MRKETDLNFCSILSISAFEFGILPFKKVCFIYLNERPLKIMKNAFYFILKLFSFLRFLNFYPNFFDHEGKRPVKRAKVSLKFNDVTTWLTKLLQCVCADNEIWSVKRI